MSFSRLMRRLSSSFLSDLDEIDDKSTDCQTTSLNRSIRNNSSNYNKNQWKSSDAYQLNDTSTLPESTLLFCKNNICVHPPTSVSTKIDHSPGYLSIKSHEDPFGGQTLLLTWIPNSQLKGTSPIKDALHSGANPLFTPPPSRNRRSRNSSISSDVAQSEPAPTPGGGNRFFHRVSSEGPSFFDSLRGMISGPPSRSASRPESPTLGVANGERVVRRISRANSDSSVNSDDESNQKKEGHKEEFQTLLNDINEFCLTKELAVDEKANNNSFPEHMKHNIQNGANHGHISANKRQITNGSCCSNASISNSPNNQSNCSHFSFDERQISYSSGLAEEKSTRDHIVGVLTADLNQMRSIRMFFSDERETSGQLVVASCESQYKIFHFHNGGLDRLSSVLRSYQNCTEKSQYREDAGACFEFSVSSLTLLPSDCHRDEGKYTRLTKEVWLQYISEDGVIENDRDLRKNVFFAGIDPSIRKDIWPFLLHYLSFKLTAAERAEICRVKAKQYLDIQQRRGSMSEAEMEVFWRSIQTIVDKDVVRTDRNNPFFKGKSNPNLQLMRNILLNYAVYNPIVGYMQGMSDLLAPLLVELKDESDAFWCFVGLMHATIFISSPTDDDMDLQLTIVRELIKIFTPQFYQHLEYIGDDAVELLFCHRWILLCFKREFCEQDALRIWECCWSRHETDYFHLFVCVAIIKVYGDDVYQKNLSPDEILLHFNTLAMHMSVDLVLKVARGLIYQFKTLTNVSCVLQMLYQSGAELYTNSLPVNVYCIHQNTSSSPQNSKTQSKNGSSNSSLCPFDKQRITSVKNYLKMY